MIEASYEFRPRSVGEILKEAFGLCRRHPAVLVLPYAIVFGFAALLLGLLVEQPASAEPTPKQVNSYRALAYFAQATAELVTYPMVMFGAGQLCGGRQPRIQEVILGSIPGLGRYFLTFLLVLPAVLAGLLAFLLPGLYLGLIWFLSPAVCVHERLRGSRALGRSSDLSKDQISRILGLVVVGVILRVLFEGTSALLVVWIPVGGPLAMVGAHAAGEGFSMTCLVLLYIDIRTRSEGLGGEAFARELDSGRPR